MRWTPIGVVASVAVVGASLLSTAAEMPTPRPGPPILRAAVRRTLAEGFDFIETQTQGSVKGRIESGTWQPPDAARRRIHWDTANNVAPNDTHRRFTEVARIGVDSYSRRNAWGRWAHTRNNFDLWPVFLLRELQTASVRFVDGHYETLTVRPGVTAVVRHGHVVAMSDDWQSYVLDAFGHCRQISRPKRSVEWKPPPPNYSNLSPEAADDFRRWDAEKQRRLDEAPLGHERLC